MPSSAFATLRAEGSGCPAPWSGCTSATVPGRRRSRLLRRLAAWLLPCGLLLAGAAPASERIVSLDLCTDWMLVRHAEPGQIAALSPLHRQYPVAWLRHDRPVHDGTLERIVELRPDLVITGQHNALQLRGRLKSLGLRVEILPLPTTPQAIVDYEKRLLALLGKPLSQATPSPAAVPPTLRRGRLLLLGANGIGTGRDTFENGLLEWAGWSNYLESSGHSPLDLERIVRHPPDAILWTAPPSRALANRFAEHPVLRRAVPRERWLSTEFWRWQCPGPWTWELLAQISPEKIR
ncbi:MAG: hypothetical protein L6Q55_10320 [Azonexus sp.]|nr:hypothetical protein [Azonexus sp.]MCK6412802.1 hypothetical protein [Azonexus sp.]